MKFDITNIDKVKLLQTLYVYSDPTIGAGFGEYVVRKVKGENVDYLPEQECKEALRKFELSDQSGSYGIYDYLNGRPLKIVFDRLISGRVIIVSDNYDQRNGKYRFLEAMISSFHTEDIMIIDKTTPRYIDINENFSKERTQHFKNILNLSTREKCKYGYYWKINQAIIDKLSL